MPHRLDDHIGPIACAERRRPRAAGRHQHVVEAESGGVRGAVDRVDADDGRRPAPVQRPGEQQADRAEPQHRHPTAAQVAELVDRVEHARQRLRHDRLRAPPVRDGVQPGPGRDHELRQRVRRRRPADHPLPYHDAGVAGSVHPPDDLVQREARRRSRGPATLRHRLTARPEVGQIAAADAAVFDGHEHLAGAQVARGRGGHLHR
nr:hypothetical protein [Pseudonocardia sp. DSM 110487]